ncbi:uncharacterized protein LOC123319928 [Coccinella septempunctata]|uniref:uncharacterized protein LOC123319928 n=1 Tax=Coccinella septempunctata TaxID=41139 RepID=UPI001D084DBC|nr:uncharacterized protein LOC123319928 [Coccinella septempunctata]
MTEKSILDLLLGNISFNRDNVDPLLLRNEATKISSGLAGNLNEIGSNPSYPSHHWKDDLMFIHKLCMKDEKHHHVDETNRSAVLDVLGKAFEKDEILEISEKCVHEIKTSVIQFMKNMRTYYHEKNSEFNSTWEPIRKDLKILEETSRLEFNLVICPKIENIYNTTSIMSSMGNNEKILGSNNDDFRLKHINFGYAVINIGSQLERSRHITILLDMLSEYEELYAYEKEFCKYLLNFIDQNNDLLKYFCDKFFFILEIQIIDICTNLIKGTSDEFKTQMELYLKTKEFSNLIAACKQNHFLHLNVKSVLYTLYCFSRFDVRILNFMKKINNNVQGAEDEAFQFSLSSI